MSVRKEGGRREELWRRTGQKERQGLRIGKEEGGRKEGGRLREEGGREEKGGWEEGWLGRRRD